MKVFLFSKQPRPATPDTPTNISNLPPVLSIIIPATPLWCDHPDPFAICRQEHSRLRPQRFRTPKGLGSQALFRAFPLAILQLAVGMGFEPMCPEGPLTFQARPINQTPAPYYVFNALHHLDPTIRMSAQLITSPRWGVHLVSAWTCNWCPTRDSNPHVSITVSTGSKPERILGQRYYVSVYLLVTVGTHNRTFFYFVFDMIPAILSCYHIRY